MTEAIIYIDESNLNGDSTKDKNKTLITEEKIDYRSIAAVIIPSEKKDLIITQLNEITESYKSELKWISGEKSIKAIFLNINKFLINKSSEMRVVILTWDMTDSRHKGMAKSDDNENIKRMIYHLCSYISRTTDYSQYRIYIDENDYFNSPKIQMELLAMLNKNPRKQKPLILFSEDFKKYSPFRTFCTKNSKESIFIQIADLFCGIACYSKNYYKEYSQWIINDNDNDNQLSLWNSSNKISFSNKQISKFNRIKAVNSLYKKKISGISLDKKKGFETLSKPETSRINYWLYKPTTQKDKAPGLGN